MSDRRDPCLVILSIHDIIQSVYHISFFYRFLCRNFELQCPTTIVPFFGDQFFWGDRIHQRGLGPAPIPISQLSVETLTHAIQFMLQPEVIMIMSLIAHEKSHLKMANA